MKKWTYKNATVTVNGNSLTVRELTAGERVTFMTENKAASAEGQPPDAKMKVMTRIVEMGSFEPKLTAEEVAEMPPDLFDACWAKIIELTGDEKPEKKAPDS